MDVSIKYLSTFLDRMIPSYFKVQYPKYELFIKYFCEFLEKKYGIYYNITNLESVLDIDEISKLLNSTNPDPEEQAREKEFGNKLIYQVYEQMLGSPEARYLSTLMDDIIFIKNQKMIWQHKGTKFAFLYFFLIIFGGYFKILNVDQSTKLHNGWWRYNGLINYDSTENSIQPFVYLIISEFYPDQYQKILDVLNPAGMFPVTIYEKLSKIVDIPSSIFYASNLYVILYNDDVRVGMIRPVKKIKCHQVEMNESYDFDLIDQTRYVESDATGYSVYIEVAFNAYSFNNRTQFNSYKIVSDPNPHNYMLYQDSEIISEYETGGLLIDKTFFGNGSESFPIINNTILQIMVE